MVDDSPVARRAVTRRLLSAGLRVVEGESAALAPGVDVSSFACALLDLDLGDGDGTQMANALRRAVPSLPLAFFSAGAPPEAIARARSWGPLFKKPDDLDRAIEWALAAARKLGP